MTGTEYGAKDGSMTNLAEGRTGLPGHAVTDEEHRMRLRVFPTENHPGKGPKDPGELLGWQKAWHAKLRSRASTIGAGTAEIERNTMAEQVLGLPRDPAMPPR
jgi:hypothetical protein